MARYKRHEKDIVDLLLKRIEALERTVRHLNNNQYPTSPIYPVNDLPSDMQDGQFFIGSDNSWRYRKDSKVYGIDFQSKTGINLGSIAAHTGGSTNITVSGLSVGDYCMIGGWSGGDNYLVLHTSPYVTSTDTVSLHFFNADTNPQNPASFDAVFIIFHRV